MRGWKLSHDAKGAYEEALWRIEKVRKSGETTLDLSGLGLESIPPEIGELTALKTLWLNNNRLTTLPEAVGELTALQTFDLNNNQLTTLPETVKSLGALWTLYLINNQLTTLPEGVEKLTALRNLYLHNNQLTTLPESLRKCARLLALFLHDNDALGLSPEVLGPAWHECKPHKSGGKDPARPADILNYYFSLRAARAKGKTRRLNEAKLLLVGQGGVGKTSLVRRLVRGEYDPHESKTEGIGRTPWEIDSKYAGEKITLNVWDFGGQEIMHATHQFFLTKRSIYLVVLDARKGENEGNIHYWLRIIQTFGGDSPVIVVTNKCDGPNDLNLNTTRLGLDYPNIRGFVKTSCESRRGIEELRKLIAQQAQAMGHVFDETPENYFTLKEELAEKAKRGNYLDAGEYRGLCEKHGVANKDDQAFALRLFHDLGTVLHYGDPDDRYHLNHAHILDPEWVTGGVYRLLNNGELFQEHGRLRMRELGRFLSDADGYPAEGREFIIGMMKRFQLCFDMPDADEPRVLIPELLLKDEPHLTWDAEGTLRFEYHYEVLPSGVLPRFIVLSHAKLGRPPTYWRSGAVLIDEGCQVLVRGDRDKGRVFIQVQPLSAKAGAKRRLALKTARVYFDQIHETISAKAMVPLPDDPGAPAVEYGYLCELERDEVADYSWKPPGASRKYSVGELLDGIEEPAERRGRRERLETARGGKLKGELNMSNHADENRAETPAKPPPAIARNAAGAVTVMSAAATILGMFASAKVAIAAAVCMVFAIFLLLVIGHAAKAVQAAEADISMVGKAERLKRERFWELVIRTMVVFVVGYFMVVAMMLLPHLLDLFKSIK